MFFVFDLDGTLADMAYRRHFVTGKNPDWQAFYKACVDDRPNKPVIAALHAHIAAGHKVEIWSARSDEVKDETKTWLETHRINPSLLKHMRPRDSYLSDDDLKLGWLKACDIPPDAIYDDRDKVVSMWRKEGITCFQVAPGNF